jgi:hypothetical protein
LAAGSASSGRGGAEQPKRREAAARKRLRETEAQAAEQLEHAEAALAEAEERARSRQERLRREDAP